MDFHLFLLLFCFQWVFFFCFEVLVCLGDFSFVFCLVGWLVGNLLFFFFKVKRVNMVPVIPS